MLQEPQCMNESYQLRAAMNSSELQVGPDCQLAFTAELLKQGKSMHTTEV